MAGQATASFSNVCDFLEILAKLGKDSTEEAWLRGHYNHHEDAAQTMMKVGQSTMTRVFHARPARHGRHA